MYKFINMNAFLNSVDFRLLWQFSCVQGELFCFYLYFVTVYLHCILLVLVLNMFLFTNILESSMFRETGGVKMLYMGSISTLVPIISWVTTKGDTVQSWLSVISVRPPPNLSISPSLLSNCCFFWR